MPRKRFLYRPGDPAANERGFVDITDSGPTDAPMAIHANLMVDRFYEGLQATDGTDIGSRRKHRDYMKRHNLTTVDDFKGTWNQASRERDALRRGQHDAKEIHDAVGRAMQRVKPA